VEVVFRFPWLLAPAVVRHPTYQHTLWFLRNKRLGQR